MGHSVQVAGVPVANRVSSFVHIAETWAAGRAYLRATSSCATVAAATPALIPGSNLYRTLLVDCFAHVVTKLRESLFARGWCTTASHRIVRLERCLCVLRLRTCALCVRVLCLSAQGPGLGLQLRVYRGVPLVSLNAVTPDKRVEVRPQVK